MAKPQSKRPMPKHLVERMTGLAQQHAAIQAAQNQLVADFIGFLGFDTRAFGLWINDDEDPPTYEVLPKAEMERRARLKQAAQTKANPAPQQGEKPLPPTKEAGTVGTKKAEAG